MEVTEADLTAPVNPPALAVQLALTGLVILADWLASTEQVFPYVCGFSRGYLAQAVERASRINDAMGLRSFWVPMDHLIPAR